MNFSLTDSFLGQQRCRQWTPLVTQQLRLRHLFRVTAYNVVSEAQGSFYYTLHLTTMSAPFYTSERIDSPNPKWAELDGTSVSNSAAVACVLRIWQMCENEMDTILLTWGINFSGLIHVGNKLSDVQPTSFKDNSVILQLRGGFFTSITTLRTDLQCYLPFIDCVNVVSTEDNTKAYRNVALKFPSGDVKKSYNVDKLRNLQFLQMGMRNKCLDVQALRDKINQKCGLCYTDVAESPSTPSPTSSCATTIRYAPQLLTMNSLNKMLQEKPTKVQKQEISRISKEIEIAKFKTKLLSQEKDKKSAHIRQLKQKYTKLADENEEKESELMDNYRNLCKEIEKLRDWKKEQIHHREVLLNGTQQLQQRRRQLLSQLLFLYPIECNSDQRYTINGVHLPNADLLQDCSVNDLPVALGFVTHVLVMCSSFLQVPLRYPVIHMGSRSIIIDHITASLGDMKREYPLYLRGKERFQFNYAVCLLNKNIAQLRWLCGLNTQNLKATLPNLLTLLQGRSYRSDTLSQSKYKLDQENILLEHNDSLHNQTNKILQNGHDNELKHANDNDTESQSSLKNSNSSNSIPFSMTCFSSTTHISDPILDTLRHECQIERSCSPAFRTTKLSVNKKIKCSETGPGLSQILAIPEAFLNQQISTSLFRNYMTNYNNPESLNPCADTDLQPKTLKDNSAHNKEAIKINNSSINCDIKGGSPNKKSIISSNLDNVEQGTDLLDPSTCIALKSAHDTIAVPMQHLNHSADVNTKIKQKRRISRSVGSYTDEEKLELACSLELGSDPLLNCTLKNLDVDDLLSSEENSHQSYIKQWLESKPEYTEENVYPETPLSNTYSVQDTESSNSPLTLRTDALLNTTSFNLVKPKF